VRRKVKRDAAVEISKPKDDPKGFGKAEPAAAAPPPPPKRQAAAPASQAPPVDVFALAAPGSRLADLRVPASLAQPAAASYGELFRSVAQAASSALGDDAAFSAFAAANRDLMDYRFQYKLTAQALAAKNLGDAAAGAERSALCDAAVRAGLRFDAPLFREVGPAEQRLGQLLGSMQQAGVAEVEGGAAVQAAGGAPQQQLAFWLVTSAAIAAWESKLDLPSVADLARQKLRELCAVRERLEEEGALLPASGVGSLSPLLRWPLPAAGMDEAALAAEARAAIAAWQVEDADERTAALRKLGCLREQCQRHAYQAYQPLMTKLAVVYDVMLYGAPQRLECEEIHAPPREGYESRLMQLSAEADKVLDESQVDRTLYF